MSTSAVGKVYPASVYAVGREKIREYSNAVGETDRLHFDLYRARAAGYADLVAPPMFAAVYSREAVAQALLDPEVGIDFARMVHGAQEFEWEQLAIAGEEISTVASIKEISERRGLGFFLIETVSVSQTGARVCRGLWTNIVRAA